MPATPDFDQWFGARAPQGSGALATAAELDRAWLSLPTGHVVAADPITFGFDDPPPPFAQAVPPGRYPVTLLIAERCVAAARLVIRDEPAASWEAAVLEGQDPAEREAGWGFGYPVEGGTGCFTDEASLRSLCEDVAGQWQQDLMLDVADRPAAATVVSRSDEDDEPVLVAFSSGEGDGLYPTWVGRNASGDVTCFVTDFFILEPS